MNAVEVQAAQVLDAHDWSSPIELEPQGCLCGDPIAGQSMVEHQVQMLSEKGLLKDP